MRAGPGGAGQADAAAPAPKAGVSAQGPECVASSSGSHSSLRPWKCLAFQKMRESWSPPAGRSTAGEQDTPRAQPGGAVRGHWHGRHGKAGAGGGAVEDKHGWGRPELVSANPRRRDCTWAAGTSAEAPGSPLSPPSCTWCSGRGQTAASLSPRSLPRSSSASRPSWLYLLQTGRLHREHTRHTGQRTDGAHGASPSVSPAGFLSIVFNIQARSHLSLNSILSKVTFKPHKLSNPTPFSNSQSPGQISRLLSVLQNTGSPAERSRPAPPHAGWLQGPLPGVGESKEQSH